jgi:hypothetical protein
MTVAEASGMGMSSRLGFAFAAFVAGCCGASTADGTTSAPLVAHEASPSLVAAGRAHVYWVEGAGSIRAAKKSDGTAREMIAGAHPLALVADDARAYYATADAVRAIDEPSGTEAMPARVLADVGGAHALALDAATVYAAQGARVVAFPKAGGAPRVVAEAQGDVGALVADTTGVCFSVGADVYFSAQGTGAAIKLATAGAPVRALAIDATGVAWLAGESLVQRDASGVSRTLVAGKLGDVLAARGGSLYFVDDGALAQVAIADGSPTFFAGTRGAYRIALGASTVYFTVHAADGQIGELLQ